MIQRVSEGLNNGTFLDIFGRGIQRKIDLLLEGGESVWCC